MDKVIEFSGLKQSEDKATCSSRSKVLGVNYDVDPTGDRNYITTNVPEDKKIKTVRKIDH